MAGTWALEESASASGREDVAEELASEHGALSDSDTEDLIAMGPATMDSEIPRPPTLSGCGWWQDPLWRSLEAWRGMAVCAGALTERNGFKVLWGCGGATRSHRPPAESSCFNLMWSSAMYCEPCCASADTSPRCALPKAQGGIGLSACPDTAPAQVKR